jgi:hypothetical protein
MLLIRIVKWLGGGMFKIIRIVEYLGGGMFKIIPQILEGEGGRGERESACAHRHILHVLQPVDGIQD